jgi:hypothetical protein
MRSVVSALAGVNRTPAKAASSLTTEKPRRRSSRDRAVIFEARLFHQASRQLSGV